MPNTRGALAVVKETGFYRDIDAKDKDLLRAGTIVRLLYRWQEQWAVYPGKGTNAMLVPNSLLVAFKDSEAAERKYVPGDKYKR